MYAMKTRAITLWLMLAILTLSLAACQKSVEQAATAEKEQKTTTSQSQAQGQASDTAAKPRPRPSATLVPPNEVSRPAFMGRAKRDARMNYMQAVAPPAPRPQPADREVYGKIDPNPIKQAAKDPVSTFSIDVDTGSYSNMRRFLNSGRLPPKDSVRVEEMINYFSYDYPTPPNPKIPFRVSNQIAPCPWNPHTLLLRIGIKGYEIKRDQRPAANLVFLLDVSGSMNRPNKLPLLKSAFKLLSKQLTARDRVSIVVYAGAAGLVLEPTPGNQTATIMAALEKLSAGGSTAGGAGIQLAYATARQSFIKDGINRILLATDGDFNVGRVRFDDLIGMVENERQTGVSLSTLGFGMGNYNERLAEQLADAGNGTYAYIDNLNEANKVLVNELSSTLFTIAGDVKIQIEFNPAVVAEYRLIGYENRMLEAEDFKNDKVDAGDIGAGHTVTALYEIALVGSDGLRLPPLRYSSPPEVKTAARSSELGFLKLRYKLPGEKHSTLMDTPVTKDLIKPSLEAADQDFRFAAAVAAFGQLLTGGKYTGDFTYEDVLALARQSRGNDPFGYRGEFLSLVSLASSLSPTWQEKPKDIPTRAGAR
jgi:Ca-activated chloride channel family protein